MKKFKIKINAEYEIKSDNEDSAIQKFWDTIIYDSQTDPATFIDENLEVEEIKN